MTGPLLTVIGDLVEDVVVWSAGPWRSGTDNPSTITRSRGGSAANVAVAAAAAGTATRFVGRVGDDDAGRRLVAGLASADVDARVQVGGATTGTIVVLVDADGERTMFNDRGAAGGLEPITDDALTGTTVLHVPAYAFDPSSTRTVVVDAAARVRAAGGLVSVDVSAVSLIDALGPVAFRGILDEVAPMWVFANREEADALGLLDADPPPGRHHVVKDGARPAVVVGPGSPSGAGAARVEVPALVVDAVRDTTGAGDAFAAGFLSAVMTAADPVAACRAGHRTAATVLATPGATPGVTPGGIEPPTST